jgi:hypothetical protein
MTKKKKPSNLEKGNTIIIKGSNINKTTPVATTRKPPSAVMVIQPFATLMTPFS